MTISVDKIEAVAKQKTKRSEIPAATSLQRPASPDRDRSYGGQREWVFSAPIPSVKMCVYLI